MPNDLEDYDVLTEKVDLPGGKSFAVRGLSLIDIAPLIAGRRKQIEAFFTRYAKKAGLRKNVSTDMVIDAGMDLLSIAPELAAEIIASAADTPHLAAKVSKLPLTAQMEALEKIGRLTFDAAGGPEKFVAALGRLVGGTTDLLSNLSQQENG